MYAALTALLSFWLKWTIRVAASLSVACELLICYWRLLGSVSYKRALAAFAHWRPMWCRVICGSLSTNLAMSVGA